MCGGVFCQARSRFLEVYHVDLLHEPRLPQGVRAQAEGWRGPFGGLRGTFRLLLRSFRILLGARLLLDTGCKLLDLLPCKGVLRWGWVWLLVGPFGGPGCC